MIDALISNWPQTLICAWLLFSFFRMLHIYLARMRARCVDSPTLIIFGMCIMLSLYCFNLWVLAKAGVFVPLGWSP
jgi:hypothetical protein